jgi:hypothetical protein
MLDLKHSGRTSWGYEDMRRNFFTSLWTGSREKAYRKGHAKYSPKDLPPVIYFLQLDPTS